MYQKGIALGKAAMPAVEARLNAIRTCLSMTFGSTRHQHSNKDINLQKSPYLL